MPDAWLHVTAQSALYVDRGRDVILCDRLPHPVELVLRLTEPQVVALRIEIEQANVSAQEPSDGV